MARKNNFEGRLKRSGAAVATALEAFERAAVALDDAATEARMVVDEVETEVLRLRGIRDDAYRQQVSYAERAEKIREFVK